MLGWCIFLRRCVVGALIAITLLVLVGRRHFGSFAAIVGFTRGERLIAEPRHLVTTPGDPGSKCLLTCRLRNLSGQPLRLLGTDACCKCRITTGLGATVAPGSIHDLQFSVTRGTGGRAAPRVVRIYTDSKEAPEAVVFVDR